MTCNSFFMLRNHVLNVRFKIFIILIVYKDINTEFELIILIRFKNTFMKPI